MLDCAARSGSLKPSSSVPCFLAWANVSAVTDLAPQIIGTYSTPAGAGIVLWLASQL